MIHARLTFPPLRIACRVSYILTTILCLFLCIFASASPHKIVNLSVRDGLGDMLVNHIHQDNSGMIWLGTGSNIACYDGVRLRTFPLSGNDSPQKRVSAIVGSPSNGLWAGNGDGLWLYDSRQEAFNRAYESDIVGGVTDLALSPDGTLYVGTTHGLYSISEGNVRSWQLTAIGYRQTDGGLPATGVRAISLDNNGTLWFTSADGLHALLPGGQLVHYYGDMPEGGFTCIAAEDGKVWLGTFHNRLYQFDIKAKTPKQVPNITTSHRTATPISALQTIGQDTLVVGTDGDGVYIINTTEYSIIKHYSQSAQGSDRLTSNSVYSVLYTASGQLWVGMYQHGLDYTLYQSDRVHVHSTPLFDSEGVAVRSLAIHRAQRLIGTRQGLWLIDKQRKLVHSWGEETLDAQMVFALHWWKDRYYVGTYGGGLWSLNPDNGQLTAVCKQLPEIGRQIFSITEDRLGNLWVGSENGAYCITKQEGKLYIKHRYTASNSALPVGLVYNIFFDRLSRGWLCTAGGMALYDPVNKTVRTDLFPAAFPWHTAVRQICQTKDGTMYFLPDKGEPFSIDEQWHNKLVPQLDGYDALFMTEDSIGNMYIGTNNGLFCYKGGIANDSCELLDFTDGLPSSIFTLCRPQIDEDGTVWLGNSNGLVWFKPDSMYLCPTPQRHVHISRILADNTPIKNGLDAIMRRSLSLPRGTSSLTVLLSDLSFTDPAYMRYEYLLEGHDNDYQQLNGVSECTWHHLKPGSYTLHIRLPQQPQSEYTMHIRVPHTLETTLIVIITILSLVIVFGIGVEIRRRKNRQQTSTHHGEAETNSQDDRLSHEKYRTANIPASELKQLKKQLEHMMEDERLYLQSELKLSDIANRLNTSPYTLSYLFNQYMDTSFYDYINNYRVETFKQYVKRGESEKYTLDTLATRCGYNSRASFFRNFKKATGMTPNEYIKVTK